MATYSHSYSGSTSISQATLAWTHRLCAHDARPIPRRSRRWRTASVCASLKAREGVYVPSLGLGAMGVSPLDMSSAYATLAAGGVYSEPMAIARSSSSTAARTRMRAGQARRRVIADWVAETVTDILEQNIQAGTGTGAAIGRPAAGKTGTTEEHSDAWFCGYTPNSRPRSGSATRRGDPDDERARHLRRRRDVPCSDLAPVHGQLARRDARVGVRRGEERAHLA